MADGREPPPMDEGELSEEKDNNEDDLFKSAVESTPAKKALEDKDNDAGDDSEADIFEDVGTEIPLDTPDEENKEAENDVKPIKVEEPTPDPVSVVESVVEPAPPKTEAKPESPKAAAKSTTTKTFVQAADKSNPTKTTKKKPENDDKTQEEIEEEESGDQYSIEITVSNPSKKGDGMSSYMVYEVNTKTTIPAYKKPELSVTRRFSDFLGIHDKLANKHLPVGRIVPPAPQKSVIGMTKVKMSKDESGSSDFVEKRRASLERYLNRTAAHSILRVDPDFRDFLETDGELPKATNTQALSGAGVKRLFNRVGEAVGKISFKMDETDQWFEEKQLQIESLDQQFKKLHSSIEALVHHRKELALSTSSFAKSCAMLGNAEEHTALSRAISQLAEIEEKVEQLYHDQADTDFFVFSELIKDYISLISAVKEVFNQRVKCYKTWKEAETTLNKKRENKAKLELARKADKLPQAEHEVHEWEDKVEKGQDEFEKISETIRKEMARFDRKRIRDFKLTVINYLESLMNNQQQLIKYWEAFLPEVKAIA